MHVQPSRVRRRLLITGAALGMVGLSQAQSSQYPSRAFRFVVPFPPGSGTDTSARYFATQLTALTGHTVVVENRPGANGFIGVRDALSAPADGYTVFIGSNSTLASNVALFKSLPYDPQKDFVPLSVLMRAPSLILVPADSPHDSLRALMTAAREAPGKLNYAAGSPGYQLIAEQFNELAGLDTNHVPFKGASEAVVAIASGVVDFGVAEVTSAQELVKAGRLRALAVAADAPTGALPDVPTAAQAGLPGMVAYLWVGAMVPAATPAEETGVLATLFTRIVEMPETRAFYARLGAETMTAGPEAMRRFQADDIALWQRIVAQAGVPQQ